MQTCRGHRRLCWLAGRYRADRCRGTAGDDEVFESSSDGGSR